MSSFLKLSPLRFLTLAIIVVGVVLGLLWLWWHAVSTDISLEITHYYCCIHLRIGAVRQTHQTTDMCINATSTSFIFPFIILGLDYLLVHASSKLYDLQCYNPNCNSCRFTKDFCKGPSLTITSHPSLLPFIQSSFSRRLCKKRISQFLTHSSINPIS